MNAHSAHFSGKASGKLLITGEYFVLDGADALCLPTRLGQHLDVAVHPVGDGLFWRSFDHEGNLWFEGRFEMADFSSEESSDHATAEQLSRIFRAVRQQNPDFLTQAPGALAESRLEFPRPWGWGSSSTLISNIARWSNTDPYRLLADTFGGSGYDIACAEAHGPIIFHRHANHPYFRHCDWQPSCATSVIFVWLGLKKNSRDAISHYQKTSSEIPKTVSKITELTHAFIKADTATEFMHLIQEHEQLISQKLQLETAKSLYFSDFDGEIKSLGAWGGDFIMAISDTLTPDETIAYFHQKGYPTTLRWHEVF